MFPVWFHNKSVSFPMPWFLQDVLYVYERLQISGDLVSATLKHVLHLFGQVCFVVFFLMYFKSVYLNVLFFFFCHFLFEWKTTAP